MKRRYDIAIRDKGKLEHRFEVDKIQIDIRNLTRITYDETLDKEKLINSGTKLIEILAVRESE